MQKIKNLVTDSKILINYKTKTKGLFWISKSSLGCRNDLKIELFFEKCSIMWSHEEYESILLNYPDGVKKKIDRSVQSKLFNQNRYNRYRMGHPSGFIEAFSNMYEDIAKDFIKKKINTYLTIIMPLKALSFSNFVLNPIKKKWLKNIKI